MRRFFFIAFFFSFFCSDNGELNRAKEEALAAYLFRCTGGTVAACQASCDPRCGVSGSLTSAQTECVLSCRRSCDSDCGAFLLLLYTTN